MRAVTNRYCDSRRRPGTEPLGHCDDVGVERGDAFRVGLDIAVGRDGRPAIRLEAIPKLLKLLATMRP